MAPCFTVIIRMVVLKYRNIYCVNCGEKGHVVKDCNGPITSFGIIAFKIVESEQDEMYDKNNKLKEILTNNNFYNNKIYLLLNVI